LSLAVGLRVSSCGVVVFEPEIFKQLFCCSGAVFFALICDDINWRAKMTDPVVKDSCGDSALVHLATVTTPDVGSDISIHIGPIVALGSSLLGFWRPLCLAKGWPWVSSRMLETRALGKNRMTQLGSAGLLILFQMSPS
jgi:hypothetical protein